MHFAHPTHTDAHPSPTYLPAWRLFAPTVAAQRTRSSEMLRESSPLLFIITILLLTAGGLLSCASRSRRPEQSREQLLLAIRCGQLLLLQLLQLQFFELFLQLLGLFLALLGLFLALLLFLRLFFCPFSSPLLRAAAFL